MLEIESSHLLVEFDEPPLILGQLSSTGHCIYFSLKFHHLGHSCPVYLVCILIAFDNIIFVLTLPPVSHQTRKQTKTYHSGGEQSLGETKYIIGDSYTVRKVWASTFGIN